MFTDFEEYIHQGEPDKIEKSQIWQTAIGLQQVDGLTPSDYLIETAKVVNRLSVLIYPKHSRNIKANIFFRFLPTC
jgi:hypothetical protein